MNEHTQIHVIWVPERKEIEGGIKSVFDEIVSENFLNLKKETDIQAQEAQSSKQDEHKETHTKIQHNKNWKVRDKERILKVKREK